MSNFRWLVVALISEALLAIVIFLIVLPLVENSGKLAYLDVLVMPLDAQVEIDGVEYRNAVYELNPGIYQATVKYEGLEPKIMELKLTKNHTTGLYLRLVDDGWQQYTEEEMTHKNGLAGVTPIYFSICGTPAKRTNCDALVINYGRDKKCDYDRCIMISGRTDKLSEEALEQTKQQLTDKGYDLNNYQYIYKQNDNR